MQACYLAGAAACERASAAYRAIQQPLARVARLGNKLDYSGGIVRIISSCIAAITTASRVARAQQSTATLYPSICAIPPVSIFAKAETRASSRYAERKGGKADLPARRR